MCLCVLPGGRQGGTTEKGNKMCVCVSCQTEGKDKACRFLKLRLQASVAARHRLVMG